ncbi:MAG: alternative ribosome rescue aminoacyl-tRNA hydrolase ArfB [Desulfocapsaceae bacterium]|jgi:ribosome-associated protein|nr:alternative ribosome rescue aminoacyl-tRNA hydrolase ArfB [Desulfocapsaceae bacterium]
MIRISDTLVLPPGEVELTQIRASGPGGQNVNKVSTAVHLRFDIKASSLPDHCKEKLLSAADQRITNDGCVIIKAQQYRSLEKNREDALQRLATLIRRTLKRSKPRKPTRPSSSSRQKRLDKKNRQGKQKKLRRKISGYE